MNKIKDLIAGCSVQMATFLQLLKKTAMHCGEAFELGWTDIDTVSKTVRITPEKGCKPRIFKLQRTYGDA